MGGARCRGIWQVSSAFGEITWGRRPSPPPSIELSFAGNIEAGFQDSKDASPGANQYLQMVLQPQLCWFLRLIMDISVTKREG
ncbi:hypothetical protein WJX79_000035 [Trebouxia sp. C0005]